MIEVQVIDGAALVSTFECDTKDSALRETIRQIRTYVGSPEATLIVEQRPLFGPRAGQYHTMLWLESDKMIGAIISER